jgi:hypothetical protein
MEDARMVYFDIPADPCAERMELFRAYARAAIAAHIKAVGLIRFHQAVAGSVQKAEPTPPAPVEQQDKGDDHE